MPVYMVIEVQVKNTDHSAPFSGQIQIHVFGTPRSGVLGILVFEFHFQSKTSPLCSSVEPAFKTTLQKTTNRGLEFFLSHCKEAQPDSSFVSG